jgi:MraZ protein
VLPDGEALNFRQAHGDRGILLTESPVIFGGHGFSPKGDKGRYVLPASFRKLVTESSRGENILHVTRHDEFNCLIGFGKSYYEKLAAKIDHDHDIAIRTNQKFDRTARELIFGNIVDIAYDNSGRLIIPGYLRDIVEIDEQVYFHASREIFMMWAPHVLERQEGPQWAVAKAACASFLNGAGKARK